MLIWKQKHVFAGVIKNGMNGQPITILLSDEAAAFQAQQKIAYNIRRVQSGFGVFILRSNTTNKVVDGLFDIICYESKIYISINRQPVNLCIIFIWIKIKKRAFLLPYQKLSTPLSCPTFQQRRSIRRTYSCCGIFYALTC